MSQQGIGHDDRRSLTLRLSVLQYVVAIAFAALAVSFWIFQIAKHEQFREMAENNFRRALPLPAPRGVLFDRNGTILVANQNTFNIVLAREQTKDIDQTLQILAEATGADAAQLKDIVNRKRREPSYRPIVLIENATDAQVVAMRARAHGTAGRRLPGGAGAPLRRRDGRRTCTATWARSARRSCSAPITRTSARERSSARRASSRPTTSC